MSFGTVYGFILLNAIILHTKMKKNSLDILQSEWYIIKCVVNVNRFQFIIILSCILFGYLKPCNE